MTEIADLLATYAALTPDERAQAEARLAGLEAHAEAHAEARRLAAFGDALTAALGPTDDDLARDLVARQMGLPGALDALAAIADPELEAQADALEARLRALAADSEDPVARFERLTGRRLGPALPPASGDSAPGELLALLGEPRPRLRLVRPTWWAAAAAVLLVAYGGLFALSASTVPERAQVAALGEIQAAALPTLRGAAAAPAADRLQPALQAVRDARRSTLGLFPAYDPVALDAAAEALEAVATDADPGSAASQEARLALGRVRLYQSRDADAARVLGGLVAQGSYQAAAARRLLDYVRAQG